MVYACGVTNTGQGHQFNKFRRLFDAGLKPKMVIVNIVSNDLDDDFFFPHTHIYNGYMVGSIETCGETYLSPDFSYKRFSENESEAYVLNQLDQSTTFRSLLRQYSLTANVIADLTRSIRYKLNERKKLPAANCRRSIQTGLTQIGELYRSSKYTLANRGFILKWIKHSKIHDYQLIFSFIPSKDPKSDSTFPNIKKFISKNSGRYNSFDEYCNAECRKSKGVYYKMDSHLNEVGNQLYAEYLFGIIKNHIAK